MDMQKVLHLKDALKLKNPKLDGEFIITEKVEGWYVRIPYRASTNTWSTPLSSAGRTIPAFAWMVVQLNTYLPKLKEDCFIIAEAYLEDTSFEITNGIFNRSVGDCSCYNVVFKLHDIIYPNGLNTTALVRYINLEILANEVNKHWFELLPIISIEKYDSDNWQRHFEVIANRGGEGIVAKRDTSIYMAGKRNSDLLKLKLELTVDCLAVALEETVGDKGNNGLVLVSRRKNGVLVRTVIGKHVDQDLFRKDSSNVIGKVVQVKAMEEYADGQLRQPVFQHVRHDKEGANYNDQE